MTSKILRTTLLAAIIGLSASTSAADYRKNPFSLTYEGAITQNVVGKVNIHPVNYDLNGINISANIYTPANYDSSKKYPTVVVAHPNGGVKEQVAGLYAQHLAELGYISITADAAYQGASGGESRNTDKPANRIEDIHRMADFISSYPGVDSNRIGLLGICGGGGYSLAAAETDKRFKSIVTLSMFNSGIVRRDGFMQSQMDTIQQRLQQASDARAQQASGGKIIYAADVDLSSITDEQLAKMPFDLYREGFIYYGRTHAHPNSTFRYPMSNLLELMQFDVTDHIDLLTQPLLMMAGNEADTLYMTEEAYKKAINTESKELFLIDGATHIQTYWKPEYVNIAVDKLKSFFAKTL
ncbi:alpha/beta hydrolase [Vibrio natriegens]|nr:alpha/beta hydrolase [Vibrio natriegens]